MLKFYAQNNDRLIETAAADTDRIVWIDMLEPTTEEDNTVEMMLGIDIPTRDEIREIEISNTLYQENAAAYATVSLLTHSETNEPEIHRVSFILSKNALVTVRYMEPKSFSLFTAKSQVTAADYQNGSKILMELLETIVSRCADTLENTAHTIDDINKTVFHPNNKTITESKGKNDGPAIDFKQALQKIGLLGDLISKCNESLLSLARATSYLEQTRYFRDDLEDIKRLSITLKDIVSLRDYANTLSGKVTFLLDATLGMIDIEQSNIIKIFSVAAALSLPPTLIASIYGMNFKHMPELDTPFGYPISIFVMALSAWIPYRVFKRRGWL